MIKTPETRKDWVAYALVVTLLLGNYMPKNAISEFIGGSPIEQDVVVDRDKLERLKALNDSINSMSTKMDAHIKNGNLFEQSLRDEMRLISSSLNKVLGVLNALGYQVSQR